MNTLAINGKLSIILIVMICASNGFGQIFDVNRNDQGTIPPTNSQKQRQKQTGEDARELMKQQGIELNAKREGSPELKIAAAKKSELAFLSGDNSRLLPPRQYFAQYAALLKDKRTGLARLYPDNNCGAGKTVSVERAEACASAVPVMGDGSYYSFRLKTNFNQRYSSAVREMIKADWADIHFTGGRITVGSDYVQGLITELTGADIALLGSGDSQVKALKAYKPDDELQKIALQKTALRRGIRLGNLDYYDSISPKQDSVYLLRSIAYRHFTPLRLFTKEEMYILDKVIDDSDLRIDTTVAFKLIGQEPDGSLIILWKELSQKPAPILKGLFK